MNSKQEEIVSENNDSSAAITGDVIGSTAYSERFVLKILLKFANLDSLKDEINEETFEKDLCTLWDMTAVTDVVDFLQKHNTLNLIEFALPTFNDDRLIEIILGILGNMCCVKKVAEDFINKSGLLALVMEYLSSSDIHILIQVLRLVNVCLYGAEPEAIEKWLVCFDNVDYTKTLMFILQNSSNKDVLLNALENLNTICSECNVEETRGKYFELFVNSDTLEGLNVAFAELTKQRELCENDVWERILVIALQITVNLNGFDTSREIFKDHTNNVTNIIKAVVDYYENDFVKETHIEPELVVIMESVYTLMTVLDLGCGSDIEQCFSKCYSIWRNCLTMVKKDEFDDDDRNYFVGVTVNLKIQTANIICKYISICNEDNLKRNINKIWKYYDDIVKCCNDDNLKEKCNERTKNYRKTLTK